MSKLQILGLCASEGTQLPNTLLTHTTSATGLNEGRRARLPFSSLYWISAVCSQVALCTTRKYGDTRDVTNTATCVTGKHVLRWGRDMSRF